MVRLKVTIDLSHADCAVGFNSLMVRLKVSAHTPRVTSQRVFQFLDGAIKSHNDPAQEAGCFKFQFLDGAIKRNPLFNVNPLVSTFQFLDGAIKSYQIGFVEFNFKMFQFLDGAIKSYYPWKLTFKN